MRTAQGPTLPDLPSGTVTFLFTNIEGSTARWEQDRAAMVTAVARHLALLEAASAAHGGVRFKTVGDAVHLAVHTAPAATATAGEPIPVGKEIALTAGDTVYYDGAAVQTERNDGDEPAVVLVANLRGADEPARQFVDGTPTGS